MATFRTLPEQPPLTPPANTYASVALRLSEIAARDLRCVLDIKYAENPAHRLDIYIPNETHGPAPVYICIHGGNWSHGYKEFMSFGAVPVTHAGAIFVAIDYRLSGEAKFPAALNDCLTAIAWTRQNISIFGGDPSRLLLGGHSAGANLAALAVLRRDLHAQYGLETAHFKGCCTYSGIYDLRADHVGNQGNTRAAIDAYLEKEEHAIDASPICCISGNEVPFFVTWGGNDYSVVKTQSPLFVEALSSAGVQVEAMELPGMDHFSIHLDHIRYDNDTNQKLAQWFRAG